MIQYLTILLAARKDAAADRGATAVEYGLLVAGIALVIIAGIVLLGDNILALFNDAGGQVANPTG